MKYVESITFANDATVKNGDKVTITTFTKDYIGKVIDINAHNGSLLKSNEISTFRCIKLDCSKEFESRIELINIETIKYIGVYCK